MAKQNYQQGPDNMPHWKSNRQSAASYKMGGKSSDFIFTFGKYRDRSIQDPAVDSPYLEFLIREQGRVLTACKNELERRAALEQATDTMIKRVVAAGYRTLAKEMHPDVGGSTEQFLELKGAAEVLTQVVEKLK